jgi:hypothetical protein
MSCQVMPGGRLVPASGPQCAPVCSSAHPFHQTSLRDLADGQLESIAFGMQFQIFRYGDVADKQMVGAKTVLNQPERS